MPEVRRKQLVVDPPKAKCDNHPDRDAEVSTTRGGIHSKVNLCKDCIPTAWSE